LWSESRLDWTLIMRKGKSVYILSKAKNEFNSIKRTNQNWMLKKSGCLQNRWNYDRYYVFSATLFSKPFSKKEQSSIKFRLCFENKVALNT
jgi:hypothetical protein